MNGMAELPTGTVTFLFTDIEGSTRLLQELGPDRYQRIQDDHGRILRAAIAEGGGTEIRTEGDAFFAVFRSPAGALRTAIRAQRDLAETPLRVRIGLHSGEGRLGGDDYVGIDVNRAARIAAAGHGGQVLLSDATRGLVEHDLPDGVRLRDLDEHRLKDIAHPERLFDLVIDGLLSDYPPLRTRDARPTNLPGRLTSFVGRREEMAETVRLLSDNRLVTLTGPGGTGKTRLALEVAAELLPSFSDGAFFVDLAPLADPGQVCPAICEAVGVREEPGSDLIDTLVNRLTGKTLLLVLDNFEHLLEEASLVGRVLERVPDVRVLVTSRIPLGLYGEQEQPVLPLTTPDDGAGPDVEALVRYEAVALFVDRARAARPAFTLTAENGSTVAGICARLDGLPLAIELAARRIKVLTPEAILARLGRSLDMLTASAPNLPERQRTLRATISWSESLLEEAERRLFARLSVFAGGIDVDAADAVANPGGDLGIDTLDGLSSLIDKSLLLRTGPGGAEPRFGMLETIREYASLRLEEAWDHEPTRRRHAEHFLALADASEPHLTGDDQTAWLDRLDREHENLQAALRWSADAAEIDRGLSAAASVWRFWHLRGHLAIGRAWLERPLAEPGERTAARAKAHGAAGGLAYWNADYDATEHHYEESLAIYRELDDLQGIAEAVYNLAFVPIARGTELGRAIELLDEARARYQRLGDERGVSKATADTAYVLMMQGDYRSAVPVLKEASVRSRRLGDRFRLTDDLTSLGQAHRLLGQHREARAAFLESLDLFEESGITGGVGAVLLMMSALESDLGRHERAMRVFGAAEVIREAGEAGFPTAAVMMGDPVGAARAAIGNEAVDREVAEGRAMSLDEALAYARSTDD
jgi:predicted ATPase/class 3 adenylate cyclase